MYCVFIHGVSKGQFARARLKPNARIPVAISVKSATTYKHVSPRTFNAQLFNLHIQLKLIVNLHLTNIVINRNFDRVVLQKY